MNRPDRNPPDLSAGGESASAADARFWQAFAEAAGFEDELRELVSSGEIDAFDANLTADDYLAADRLHEALLAARAVSDEPATVELANRRSTEKVDGQPRRLHAWLAGLSLMALASVVAVAIILFFNEGGTETGGASAEIASAQRLAEEWMAVRREARPRDLASVEEAEFVPEPPVDAIDFEETPDWLVVAIAHQAELGEGAIEEGTP